MLLPVNIDQTIEALWREMAHEDLRAADLLRLRDQLMDRLSIYYADGRDAPHHDALAMRAGLFILSRALEQLPARSELQMHSFIVQLLRPTLQGQDGQGIVAAELLRLSAQALVATQPQRAWYVTVRFAGTQKARLWSGIIEEDPVAWAHAAGHHLLFATTTKPK